MSEPSPEDIAYVEEVCRLIRANLKVETERVARKALVAKPVYVVNGDAALAAVQRDLGLSATPSVDQDRNEALQRMERE